MPLIAILFFYLFAVNSFSAKAQEGYKAGFSRVSIEPHHYPFSLALAGYGAPRDGRFSLEWIKSGVAEGSVAFTSMGNALLKLSNQTLFTAVASGKPLIWKQAGGGHDLKLIAGAGKLLYAVNAGGDVLVTSFPGKISWKKIGEAREAVAITVLNNALYVANNDGDILSAAIPASRLDWQQVAFLEGVTSLAAYKDCLYALLAKNDLLKFNPSSDTGWLKIARYNEMGYDVKLNHIAVAGDRLFGCDQEKNVYIAQHQTDGHLSVSAMAVSSGKQTVVMAGVDVCGFDYDVISTIKQEIAIKYHLPASAILINASHTHYSPLAQRYYTWSPHGQIPDSGYLFGTIKPAIIQAIGEALKSQVASTLSFGRGKTAIGRNRSLSEAPPYDDDVDVVMAVRKDNRQKIVLFLTGCHPVFNNIATGNTTISANYPAVSRQTLEHKGINHTLFLQGCAGDINPRDADHVKTGEALAANVLDVLAVPMQSITGGITYHMDSILFPVTPMPHAQIVALKDASAPHVGDVDAEKNVRWANLMLKQEREGTMPNNMPVYVQTINIGNWKLVGVSREVVTDYSIGIKKLWPGKLVSVAGYCNDIASYLPTSRHIKAGTYEGYNSFLWYAQPGVFPENVYETILNKIRVNNY
jgi:hypothetical protein